MTTTFLQLSWEFDKLSVDPTCKLAILTDEMSYFIISTQRGSNAPKLLDEESFRMPYAITTAYNNYLYPLISRTTDRLIESGIYMQWYNFILDVYVYRKPLDPDEPKVFSIDV